MSYLPVHIHRVLEILYPWSAKMSTALILFCQNELHSFWGISIPKHMSLCVIQVNKFRGDVIYVSAKTKSPIQEIAPADTHVHAHVQRSFLVHPEEAGLTAQYSSPHPSHVHPHAIHNGATFTDYQPRGGTSPYRWQLRQGTSGLTGCVQCFLFQN